jgi:hypothetical protein
MVKVAIFHEGNENKTNDNEILKLLLEKLSLPSNQVKFVGMGPKSNFFKADNKNYKQLKLDIESEQIRKVLFMIDADYVEKDVKYGGCENTRREIQKTVEELGIADISDIYITCDDTNCGYLESLILSTIPDERKKCIEDFLACSDFASKENHKAILNQIYKAGYPKAPFDLEHPNFNELKQKLTNLFA